MVRNKVIISSSRTNLKTGVYRFDQDFQCIKSSPNARGKEEDDHRGDWSRQNEGGVRGLRSVADGDARGTGSGLSRFLMDVPRVALWVCEMRWGVVNLEFCDGRGVLPPSAGVRVLGSHIITRDR